MRKPSLSAILGVATCLVLFCACRKDGNEQVFDELDRVISQKSCYAAPDDTSRWQMAHHLFNAYITYDIDSAARYSELMYRYAAATGDREMQFLSTTCDAGVQIARNNVGRAYKLILSLDTVGINKRMRANYYTQQMAIFGRLAASEGPEEQRHHRRREGHGAHRARQARHDEAERGIGPALFVAAAEERVQPGVDPGRQEYYARHGRK